MKCAINQIGVCTISECSFAPKARDYLIDSAGERAVYELQGDGRAGDLKFFRKPWAMTTVMFLGMTFCLPLAFFEEYLAKKRERDLLGAAAAPLLVPQQVSPTSLSPFPLTIMSGSWEPAVASRCDGAAHAWK